MKPISLEICHFDQKYMPIIDTVTKRVFPKNSKESICIYFCALDFFPEIALSDHPENWHIFWLKVAYCQSYRHMPSQTLFLDFSEIAFDDGPKETWIRVDGQIDVSKWHLTTVTFQTTF